MRASRKRSLVSSLSGAVSIQRVYAIRSRSVSAGNADSVIVRCGKGVSVGGGTTVRSRSRT